VLTCGLHVCRLYVYCSRTPRVKLDYVDFFLLSAIQLSRDAVVAKLKPTTLRLSEVFKKMIELLQRERHFNDRTAYFEQLVREDWDNRATPQMEAELTALLAGQTRATSLALNESKLQSPSPLGARAAASGSVASAAGSPVATSYRKTPTRGTKNKPKSFPKG
jgi:hypothetical protein